jgi:hypothetical protein
VPVPLDWCSSACTIASALCTTLPPMLPHRMHTAGNGARAHGARAKAGAKSFFLSFNGTGPNVQLVQFN